MRSTTLISLRTFFATFLAVLALTSPAFAQKKKGDTKKPEPAKEEVDENAGAWGDGDNKKAPATGAADEQAAAPKKDLSSVEPPAEQWDPYNVEETPGKYYFFVGLRYR